MSIKKMLDAFCESEYSMIAPAFRGVGEDEIEGILRILTFSNNPKDDLDHFYRNHPETIAFNTEFMESRPCYRGKMCNCHIEEDDSKIYCKMPKPEGVRNTSKYKEWRLEVFERDEHTCQDCGQRGGKLNAHHIKSYIDHVELRLDVDNGITLCCDCHKLRHRRITLQENLNEQK